MLLGSRLLKTLPFLFTAILFFLPLVDTDLGWHLRYGNYLLENGKILESNSLTYFLPHYYWVNPSTFYDLLVSLTNKFSSLIGLSVLYSFIMLLTFSFFHLMHKNLLKINLLFFLFSTLFGWTVFSLGFRSQILSFSFLILIILLIKLSLTKPKFLFLIPFLMLIWANSHGGFFLGLIFLFFSALNFLLLGETRLARQLFLTTLLSTLATLINPFGLGIYSWALLHAEVPLRDLIAEWVPPNLSITVLVILISSIAGILTWIRNHPLKIFWLMSIVLLSILTLEAQRNIPLWSAVVSLALLDSFEKPLERLENNFYFKTTFQTFLVLAIILLSLSSIPKTIKLSTNFPTYCEKGLIKYPCQAIDFIKKNPPKGDNIFTAYEWGGFLEWQLPEYKYFVDGRMPAWPTPEGKSPYTIYLELLQAQMNYQQKLDSYGTDALLIQNGTFLDLELKQNPSVWGEIYRDSVAVVYVRR